MCRRHPQHIWTPAMSWCGEWDAQVAALHRRTGLLERAAKAEVTAPGKASLSAAAAIVARAEAALGAAIREHQSQIERIEKEAAANAAVEGDER